jgi:hypothetical protein
MSVPFFKTQYLTPPPALFYTIPNAAAVLNINPRKLAFAVDAGIVCRHIRPLGERQVLIADILSAINCSHDGGWQ